MQNNELTLIKMLVRYNKTVVDFILGLHGVLTVLGLHGVLTVLGLHGVLTVPQIYRLLMWEH